MSQTQNNAVLPREVSLSAALPAFVVDLFRNARAGTMQIVVGFCITPFAFAWLLFYSNELPLQDAMQMAEKPFRFYFNYVAMLFFSMTTYAALVTARVARRNAGLPVSSRLLSLWHLGSMCGLVLLTNLVIQTFYRFVYGVTWPIVTTSVAITTLAAVVLAVGFWLRDSRIHRLFVGVVLVAGAGRWFLWRLHGNALEGDPIGWFAWRKSDFAILAFFWAIAWGLFHAATIRHRRGEPMAGRFLEYLQNPTMAMAPAADGPDHRITTFSESAAFASMERTRLRPLLRGMQCGIVFMLGTLFSLIIYGERSDIDGLLPLTLIMSGLMGFMGGSLHAASLSATPSGKPETNVFTLPISDERLSRYLQSQTVRITAKVWLALHFALLISVLVCWCLLGSSELLRKFESSNQLTALGWRLGLFPFAALLITWTACGLSMSGCLLPPRAILWALGTGVPAAISLFVAVVFDVPGALEVAQVLIWTFACLICGVGTAWLIWRTTSRQLLDRRRAAIVLSLAVTLAVVVALMSPLPSPYWKSVAAGLTITMATPVALIPLTLSQCRHRLWDY